jgi:Flp pilus assembly protein TadG
MRVVDRARADERGAVAVIVAICALVLFAFAAYAIDAGHAWQVRRSIVTAADAAALAAAGQYATGNDGCATAAADYLERNVADAVLVACEPGSAGTDRGHVTVQGQTTAKFSFAGLFGIDDDEIRASTTAQWGIPTGVRGLRPYGLCLDATPELTQWLNLPAGPTGPSDPITIMYAKSHPDACGGDAPGNWGVLDFDGGANSNADLKDWTLNGYSDEVSISPPAVPGETGAFSTSVATELGILRDSGAYFALPIFDSVSGTGSTAEFNIVAFVWVRIIDFQVSGAQANRFMTLVFDRGVLEGRCCGTGIDTGARVLRICDVDTLSPETTDPRGC